MHKVNSSLRFPIFDDEIDQKWTAKEGKKVQLSKLTENKISSCLGRVKEKMNWFLQVHYYISRSQLFRGYFYKFFFSRFLISLH